MAKVRLMRIDADQIEAGDMLVVKEGSIRKFRHVCEFHQRGRDVEVVINVPNGFEHLHFDADDRVRVRE